MDHLNKNRPILTAEILQHVKSDTEAFQNRVLRPVIKMQSDILMLQIQHKLSKLHVDWNTTNPDDRRKILTQLFTKEQSFKSEICGIVIGQFSIDELADYHKFTKEINKRIVQIVHNRALDLLLRVDI